MERESLQRQARTMAQSLGRYLLAVDEGADPQRIMPDAVSLIQDCARHLGLPELAFALVEHIHPLVERWSTWALWAGALDALLGQADHDLATRARARLLIRRSHAARELGDFAAAAEDGQRALALATELGDAGEMAVALNKLGVIAMQQGQMATAADYFTAAEAQAAATQLVLERGNIALNLGTVQRRDANTAAARANFERAIEFYRAAGDAFHMAKAQCNLVDLDARAGRLHEVPPELPAAVATFQRLGARYDYALGLNDLGYLQLTLKQYAEARGSFSAAIAECDAIGALVIKARVMSNLGELYVTTRDYERADATLAATRELAMTFGMLLLASYVDVDRGRMLWDQGDYSGARALWAAAYEAQTAAGAQGDAAQTLRLLEREPDV